jgi:NADH-quinone oxidoreductase subunit H
MPTVETLWNWIGNQITGWLGTFLPAWAVTLIWDLVLIIILVVIGIVAVLALSFMERKVAARMGDRYGPNRWGPYGFFQPFADALKMLIKEDIVPQVADKLAFNLAPGLVTFAAVLTYAVIPFGKNMVPADLNIGILFFSAIGSLTILGLLTAGWGSDNKYSLLSAFRAAAQLVSYEVPMALAIISVVLAAGTLSTGGIVAAQAERGWFIFSMPGVFLVYLLAASAELGRCPFDLYEADSEIVAGHMTEYSGMKFALFFLAEYINLFAVSGITVGLFLGGGLGPILPSWLWFPIKVFVVIWVFMWIRNTFPRLRIDQVLGFSWKVLVPAGLANLMVVGLCTKLFSNPWLAGGSSLIGNGIVFVATILLMGRAQRRRELAAEGAALRA